ncbi:MAG: 2-C-methyl-D-erythritol 4-phosphate cytidylyltransferase [Tyzzerella sp.]|nr:2-C-methyl-D-erythritol 4-phosphate cytidylyltransferase [Tyzzerella sp.]
MQKAKCTAIVLAGGQGKRMGTKVQKQYLEIQGKPVLYYSLHTFQNSELIDEIILVVGENQEEYCRREIVDKFEITKVTKIVVGGSERYYSVWNGLCAIDEDGYVFIHDGARPFINDEILNRAYEAVQEEKACVVGMPVKDTIKIADENAFAKETPNRNFVWMVQTPQVFETTLVKKAYGMLMEQEYIAVTDDAMVVETMLGQNVKLVEGSYQNIKITTPEDLAIAEVFASI